MVCGNDEFLEPATKITCADGTTVGNYVPGGTRCTAAQAAALGNYERFTVWNQGDVACQYGIGYIVRTQLLQRR